jgi:hypothetical protein
LVPWVRSCTRWSVHQAKFGALDGQLAHEFVQQGIVGVATGIEPQRADDVGGHDVPVEMELARGGVQEHPPNVVALACWHVVPVGDQRSGQ